MFHAETPPSCKDDILKSLRIDNAMIRIVICTSALECGVNVKNVRYVIHYGPSYDVVDFCQQIGELDEILPAFFHHQIIKGKK